MNGTMTARGVCHVCGEPATGVKLWPGETAAYLGDTLFAYRCDYHAEDSHEPLDSGRPLDFWRWLAA